MITSGIDNRTRREVYRRDGYMCAICGSTHYLQIHHAVPRSHCGSNTPMNLITLCSKCHAMAHDTDIDKTGFTSEDMRQAITEYLADYYAGDWWPYKEIGEVLKF